MLTGGQKRKDQSQAISRRAAVFTLLLEGSNEKFTASDSEKLDLYGLFKQATLGDCPSGQGSRSGLIANTKTRAWLKFSGLSKNDAKIRYVDLTCAIAPGWDSR